MNSILKHCNHAEAGASVARPRLSAHASSSLAGARISADTLGVAASSLCLVHCLVMPLAVMALPSLAGQFVHDDLTHYFLAFFVTAFCLTAIVPGYLRHGSRPVLVTMAAGLSLVLFASFFAHPILGEAWEIPLITLGNLIVVCAHLRNRRLLACSH